MQEKSVMKEALKTLLVERVHQIAFMKAQEHEGYQQATKNVSNAFDALKETLTTDQQKKLLDKLESEWFYAKGFMLEFAYRQGVQDSRMIHKELRDFGISINDD